MRLSDNIMANYQVFFKWLEFFRYFLIEPIEAIAQRVNPDDYKGFYEPLDKYWDETIRIRYIQNQLQTYENERTHRGPQGSQEIDSILLSLPQREMKLSEIKEYLEKRLRRISKSTGKHLAKLIKSGKFDKTKEGFYIRKR